MAGSCNMSLFAIIIVKQLHSLVSWWNYRLLYADRYRDALSAAQTASPSNWVNFQLINVS